MFGFFKETFKEKTKNARAVLEVSEELMTNLGVTFTEDKENNKRNLSIINSIVFTAISNEYLDLIPSDREELDLRSPMSKVKMEAWLDFTHYSLISHREYYEDGYITAGTGPKTLAVKHLKKWIIHIVSQYSPDVAYKSKYQDGIFIPINDLRVLITIATIHNVYELYNQGDFNGCSELDSVYFYKEYLSFWNQLLNSSAWTEAIYSGDYSFKKSEAYKNNSEVRDFYDSYQIKFERIVNNMLKTKK
tara:strand:- start:5 stop:745 length:741 start_codon:yes stop_codon:yes gene_type:complete